MFSGSISRKSNRVIGSDNNICRSSNNNNNNNKSAGGNMRMLLFPLQIQQQVLYYALLLLLILLSCQIRVVDGGLGIPGAAATKSGYDTEVGQDAMCWRSVADQGPAANLSVPNPLVANFKLLDAIQLLNECPTGNVLRADPPVEMALRGERLRTFQFYNYTVDITLNLTSLSRPPSPSLSRGISRRGLAAGDDDGGGGRRRFREHDDDNDNYKFVSDWGPRVAIQIVVCSLGNSGFCSPYIHEEANARLFRLGLPLSPEPGYRHGGSHVHSPYKFVDLNPSEGPIFNISLQVPMLVNVPGAYFAVAAIQMMIARSEFAPVEIRYDMANAMHEYEQRIVHYQDPAVILEVPPNVKICSYIAIGIAGSVLLYLLVETVRNCTHQVIRLTQGSFLIMFLAVALTATVCSFLFEPKNDLYCQASYPILLICLQCMYAITLGRLWRINSMISPLLVRTMAGRKLQPPAKSKSNLHQKSSLSLSICTARNCMELAGGKLMELTRSVAFFGSPDYRNMDARGRQTAARSSVTSSVRMKITDWHLARVVFFFTFPQVIMQIMSVTLQPHTRVIEFNADESVGRATCRCTREIPAYMSILYWSCFMFLLLLLMLLVMSAGTRKLPSLFSETQDIMDSAISSLVLLVLGVAIILVTTEPTVSPGVQYLVCVFMALSVCLNLSLRIMLPKLQMVWRGEVVLVSKLVSDHNRQIKEHDRQMYNPKKTAVYVTGVKMNNTSSGDFNHRSTVSSSTPIPGGGMPLPSNSVEVEEAMESLSDEESSVNMANVFDDDDEELDNDDGCDDEGHVVEIEEEIDENDDENDDINNQDDLTETEVGVNDVESPTPATVSGELSSSSTNGEQQQQVGAAQQQLAVPEIVQQLLPPQSHHSAPAAATSTASVSPLSIATTENHLTSPSSSGAFVAAPTANSPRQVVPATAAAAGVTSARQSTTRSQNNLSASSVMSTIQQRQQALRQRVQSEKGSHRLILISSDESPARRLILKMVDAQEQLAAVNERVMSGRTVSEHEWETTRKLANRLSDTFRREVLFTWETGYGSSSSGAMSSPYGSSATLTTRNNGVRRRKSSTSKRREQDVIQEGNEEEEDDEEQSGGC